MRSALKKITAILAISALLCLASCSQGGRVDIDKVTFGRRCVAISLTREALVQKVSIYCNQKKAASKEVEKRIKRVFLDFDWEKGKDYHVEVEVREHRSPVAITVRSPRRPSPILLASFRLEDVEPRGLYDSGYLGGRVAISSDGRYAAVGTEKSYLRLFEVANRQQLWSKRIGEGRILAIAFSHKGRYLLVGEQSRDAYIYCFDSQTGKELWKYRAADDVGEMEKGEPRYRWPVVTGIAVAGDKAFSSAGKCYVAAKRQFMKKGDYYYLAKVYCFDIATGRIIWSYPRKGCMDASPSMLETDSLGRYLLFNNYKMAPVHDKALYCLDGKSGHILWGWRFKPLFPENKVLIWHGFGISQDGRYVAALTQDGRGYLLDNQELIKTHGRAHPLWERDISIPMIVNGLTLFGYGSVAAVTSRYVLFSTGNTHARLGKKGTLSIEHPTANSLFVYSLEGNLLWTCKIGGLCYSVPHTPDGRYIVLAARHSRIERDTSRHGVYLFDNLAPGGASNKLVWFYHTSGICLAADISPDGKHIVALEYPVDMDLRDEFEDVRGKHMVYLLR